ncbi:MAG: flagellar motor switch protein FliN, partial [Tepidanaerobacteraceae bacterium]
KSEIMQLMPIPFAKTLVEQLFALSTADKSDTDMDNVKSDEIPETHIDQIPEQKTAVSMAEKEPEKTTLDTNTKITVNPVEFHEFQEEPISTQTSSLELILDVPLEVTVELGRTNKTIKEILEISPGTIVELDKMAGEPVDILVNGKLVAKGEVVVIDENFGVRITEIINSIDRVKSLQ